MRKSHVLCTEFALEQKRVADFRQPLMFYLFLNYSPDMSYVFSVCEVIFNYAVLSALGVYVLAAADVDRRVLHRSVTVTVEADDIAALDVFFRDLFALLGLGCSAVRQ